jgi:multiple sugar transport system permease protein
MATNTMTTQQTQPPITDKEAVQRRHRFLAFQRGTEQVIVRIFLIAMCLIFLAPLYWMFVTALKTTPELSVFPPTFWPTDVQWANFWTAVNYIPFGVYFWNSLIISLTKVVGAVLSNMLVAYGFSCINWPGRDKVFYLVIATLFLPFPVAMIPLFDLFATLKWVDSALPLVVPTFFASAFNVFLLRQFLMQIPRELSEAARIDGASEWQILWRIMFPLSLPAIGVVSIFTAVDSWKDFTGPLIYIQNDAFRTLSIGLQFFRKTHDIQFNLLMAASFLTVLPLIALFLIFQRFFVRGMTIGSIR